MNSSGFLDYLTSESDYSGQIAHVEHLPAVAAEYGELDKPLLLSLEDILKTKGLYPLYHHQAQAVNAVRRGENIIVSTRSASGKTLCYNLPVLEAMLELSRSRALYLYPTKALAQDQLRSLADLASPDLTGDIAIFDGDTPYEARAEIRGKARLILTNPDMLHLGILPNHQSWAPFFRSLKFVVVDEAHVYRGIFGAHVAGVMRRLRRLCDFYGVKPRFILSSATVANPGEHAEKLIGLPFSVVSEDGSPHGEKEFVFWNPPLVDKAKSLRRSANSEATHLFTELVRRDIRTLTFARTRRLAELIYVYARDKLMETEKSLARRISPYRAGYLPELRRKIEKALFSGELLGAVATSALELGINIGDLEATVLIGYPGSIASTWQQAGRSGRGERNSLSFLVAVDNPLDQYFMRHPESFFKKGFEHALVNPENPYVLKAHLICAAWEMALVPADERYFGASFKNQIQELLAEDLLRERRGRWYLPPAISYPAQDVGIRGTSGVIFTVWDTEADSLIETVPADVAFFQIYPGAVYLHQGEPYLITKLDLSARTAYARPTGSHYYTETKEINDLHVIRELRQKKVGDLKVSFGEVAVTTAVVGFKKKRHYTEEVIGEEPLDLPPINFETLAFWFELPSDSVSVLTEKGLDFAGGLHAAEHAAIAILPLFALCDRNDIGGLSTSLHPDTGKAQIFIYDAYPGGIGIAEKG
ncbi:MAG: DEAD/DEAH box helicase, partial [Chloroflexota bacterium]